MLTVSAVQMVKAIQVLRIHLLELEKVSDLCKDFCSRYIACLKTKMNSETLLSGEPGSPYSPVQGQVQGFSPTKTQVRTERSHHNTDGVFVLDLIRRLDHLSACFRRHESSA